VRDRSFLEGRVLDVRADHHPGSTGTVAFKEALTCQLLKRADHNAAGDAEFGGHPARCRKGVVRPEHPAEDGLAELVGQLGGKRARAVPIKGERKLGLSHMDLPI
jgi:hypothetical protein